MAGERVTPLQVTLLLALSRFTITLVYFPAMADPGLKQVVWLLSLLGALLGIPFAWVLNKLWLRFPGQTFIQVLETVLGKAVGKAVSLAYLFFLFLALSTDFRLGGEFYVSAFLPLTPIIVTIGVIAFLTAWVAKAGVEVIGRAGEVIFPFLIGSILLVFVLLLKDIQFKALTPVFLQSGFATNFKQMFNVMARNTEFVWLAMLVPFVNDRHRLFPAVVYGLVWQGAIWVIMGIAVTGVLGAVQQFLYFPFFSAVSLISVADFVERVDAIILSAWFLGMFLRGGMILWALALGTAQWLGLKHYRPLVVPITALAVTGSIIIADSFSELRSYLAPEIFTPYMLLFIWIIPVLVLAIAWLRGLRECAGGTSARGGA